MQRLTPIFLTVLLAVCCSSRADSVYDLIKQGNLKGAGDTLASLPSGDLRDGNMLFYAGLIESDATKATDLLRAALESGVAALHREQIYYLLANYYWLQDDIPHLRPLLLDYLTSWEVGRYRRHMQRLAVLLDEKANASEAAIRLNERYLSQTSDAEAEQWGLVDKARLLSATNKKAGARDVLTRLSRKRSGPGVPQALYVLAKEAMSSGKLEDALLYYNLLRDAYPAAVGLEALEEELLGMPAEDMADTPEEPQDTGPRYSVQVGVFSVPANAERMAQTIRDAGHKVAVAKKTISGTRYNVVLVGSFGDYDSAASVKHQLEREHQEIFQVVTR